MKSLILALMIAVANPAAAEVLPCLDWGRDNTLQQLKDMTDGKVFDLIGPITEVKPGVCDVRMLAADGVHELQFELRKVQGKGYFHGIRDRIVPGP